MVAGVAEERRCSSSTNGGGGGRSSGLRVGLPGPVVTADLRRGNQNGRKDQWWWPIARQRRTAEGTPTGGLGTGQAGAGPGGGSGGENGRRQGRAARSASALDQLALAHVRNRTPLFSPVLASRTATGG